MVLMFVHAGIAAHANSPAKDPAEAARIVAGAHQVCPYSNATRGNIDVKLIANGEPVG